MFKYKVVLLVFTVFGVLSFGFSQSAQKQVLRHPIVTIQTQYAGTIAVDENGKEITDGKTTTAQIFVTTALKKVQIQSLSIGNFRLNVSATAVSDFPFFVGINAISNDSLLIKRQSGANWLQIQTTNKDLVAQLQKQRFITLFGRLHNKKFCQKLAFRLVTLKSQEFM